MQIDLTGRSAIITGGSTGLGLAMAKRLSASGADVAILARRPDVVARAVADIETTAKGQVAGFGCDVSKLRPVKAAFVGAEKAFGKIDIVINNAGISRAMPFLEATDDIWQEDLELKLFAAIRLARLALPGMMERRWGRIINVLNIGAKAPRGASAPTSVSRAAGMALTKVLAHEGAPYNVLVNAMLVGLIRSDQWDRRYAAARADGSNEDYETFIAKLGSGVPMKRMGTAEEFASLACFLCSEQGGYVTGTAINVDGGSSPVV
jgi:NAD(P)-dependent dehydrogenase (short-subunit alcohol dehydrogenase family)